MIQMSNAKRPAPAPKDWTRRPRVRRAFLAWFSENRHRFLVPLDILEQSDNEIGIRMEGISHRLAATLTPQGLSVDVFHQGQWFDRLFDQDICPTQRVGEGYVCNYMKPTVREIFPTKEDVWRDHVWEEFVLWINQRLYPARWLRLAQTHGVGSANLFVQEQDLYRMTRGLEILAQLTGRDGKPLGGPNQPWEIFTFPVRE